MSTKIDQSLDEIMANTGSARNARAQRNRRRPGRKPSAQAAPAGGVAKTTRAAKTIVKRVTPTGPAAQRTSKVIASNLPRDIDEGQIKDYFSKTAGPIKKVEIAYGPNGVSRGVVNITFSRADGANKALTLDGILIDGKPLKIEVIVDASHAPAVQTPKPLHERVSQPKGQPKSAAVTKATGDKAGAQGAKGKKARGGRARNARPAKKTKEELDSEMMDYFPQDVNAAAAPVAATGGDAAMEDTVL